MELEAFRDKVSALHFQAGKDMEAMVGDYQKVLEQIFNYGCGCCEFIHGILGDRPRIPDGMPESTDPLPLEFFCESGVPPRPQQPLKSRRGGTYS